MHINMLIMLTLITRQCGTYDVLITSLLASTTVFGVKGKKKLQPVLAACLSWYSSLVRPEDQIKPTSFRLVGIFTYSSLVLAQVLFKSQTETLLNSKTQ